MAIGARDERDAIEIEFHISDRSYPFVEASETENCRLELEVIFPHSEEGFVEYFGLDGAPPERVLEVIDRSEDVDAELVARHDDGGRVRVHVRRPCVAITVVDFGAVPGPIAAEDGEGRVVAEVASKSDATDLVERFEREHPSVTFDGYRTHRQSTPVFTRHEFTQFVMNALTDRQREVFLTAYMNGYYDWPRKHEATELADDLDISPATFSQHLRAAEGKIFNALLDIDDESVHVE